MNTEEKLDMLFKAIGTMGKDVQHLLFNKMVYGYLTELNEEFIKKGLIEKDIILFEPMESNKNNNSWKK